MPTRSKKKKKKPESPVLQRKSFTLSMQIKYLYI